MNTRILIAVLFLAIFGMLLYLSWALWPDNTLDSRSSMSSSNSVEEVNKLCWSRGPRIGDEGVPYCKRPEGHSGLHNPSLEDGWRAGIRWGAPDMRDPWKENAIP